MTVLRKLRARQAVALRATAVLCYGMTAFTVHAQSVCGLTNITEAGKLHYPTIARAARVQGPVVLLASFAHDGTVSQVKIVSAPLLLDQLMGEVAAEYVRTWRANPYSGPRECPIVVEFALGAEASQPKVTVSRVDLQHVRITAEAYAQSQPNYSIATSR